ETGCGLWLGAGETTAKYEIIPWTSVPYRQYDENQRWRSRGPLHHRNIDRERIARHRRNTDELFGTVEQGREARTGRLDRELVDPSDSSRCAAHHVGHQLNLVMTIEFRFPARMKLRFHPAARRHAANKLKLNFQYAAVVGHGLPGLVDDRFAVGVGLRTALDGELRGTVNPIGPWNSRVVDEPIEHHEDGLARRRLPGWDSHRDRSAERQGFAFGILRHLIIDQNDCEIEALVGASCR